MLFHWYLWLSELPGVVKKFLCHGLCVENASFLCLLSLSEQFVSSLLLLNEYYL